MSLCLVSAGPLSHRFDNVETRKVGVYLILSVSVCLASTLSNLIIVYVHALFHCPNNPLDIFRKNNTCIKKMCLFYRWFETRLVFAAQQGRRTITRLP